MLCIIKLKKFTKAFLFFFSFFFSFSSLATTDRFLTVLEQGGLLVVNECLLAASPAARRLRWCRWGGRRWARGQPRSSCSTSPAWPGCVCRRCTCAGWRCEAGSRRQKRGVGVGDLTQSRSDPIPRHGRCQHRQPENASNCRVPFAVTTSIHEPNQRFVTRCCYFSG